MKKILLTMAAVFACSAMASAVEVSFDFATNDYGLTRTSDNKAPYITEGSISQGDVTITFKKNDGSGLRLWTDGLRVMKKSGISVAANGQNITEIVIETAKNSQAGYLTTTPEGYASGTWSGSATDVTFTNDPEKGTVALKKITITYGGAADTRKPAGLSFPEEHYNVVLGEAFTAPVLTKETTAAVTYSSDKEEVATVDAATGAVTVVGIGTARIIAKAEANDEYKAGEASYLLTVEDPAVANAIYSGLEDNADDWTIDNGTLPEGLTYIWSWDKNYKYLKASAYKGGNFVSSATVTSPEIDLTGVKNATLSFSQVGNFFKGNMQNDVKVLISADGGDFTELTVAPWPEVDGWKPWVESSADLKAFDGKKIKVQFLYTSTAERAGTWEIKSFIVGGEKTQGVTDVEAADDAPAVYYNLQGVRVANPENGLFIKVQGKKSSKVYIK